MRRCSVTLTAPAAEGLKLQTSVTQSKSDRHFKIYLSNDKHLERSTKRNDVRLRDYFLCVSRKQPHIAIFIDLLTSVNGAVAKSNANETSKRNEAVK